MTDLPKPARYLLGGLLIGAMWVLNRHRPPWEEALRTIVVFTILMVALRAKLRSRVQVHLVPLVACKAVLVGIAAVVEQGLLHAMGNPTDAPLFVAGGLVVAVTLLGPIGDGQFFTPVRPASQVPEARCGQVR